MIAILGPLPMHFCHTLVLGTQCTY